MEDDGSKITSVLNRIRERRAGTRRRVLSATAILIVLALSFGWAYMQRSRAAEAAARLATADEKLRGLAEISRERDALRKALHDAKAVRILAEGLPIKNLQVRRTDGSVFVTGEVHNAGGFEVGDIELTAYCMDAERNPVHEERLNASSLDGRPLKKYQRRGFSFKIDAPAAAKDVIVLVTGVEVVEGERGD